MYTKPKDKCICDVSVTSSSLPHHHLWKAVKMPALRLSLPPLLPRTRTCPFSGSDPSSM